MNRLKAILAPASPAGARPRRVVVGLSALVAGLACAGSFAVAAQRQPVITPAPADIAAGSRPVAAAAASPRPAVELGPRRTEQAAPDQVPAPAPSHVPQLVRTEVAPEPAAAPAAASGEQAQPAEISRVTWQQPPSPMFPSMAASNGVREGRATLLCNVEADGRASGCTVLAEDPPGQGFGEAALASMEGARFSAALMETATPGRRARFTIRFRVAD